MFGPSIIGIDMGTANTRVYTGAKGELVAGSSVVAIDARSREVFAFGDKAKEMLGKTPEHIVAVRPIRDGAISDFNLAVTMLKGFIQEARRKTRRFGGSKLNAVICAPADVTALEKKAIHEAAIAAGASSAIVIESILAAAMGADLPACEATGSAILNIGGGKTEAAVISLGGIVTSVSVKAAGNAMDSCIQTYMKRNYNVIIGEHTAELLKMQLGSGVRLQPHVMTKVAGLDCITGIPRWVDVSSDDIHDALTGTLSRITAAIKRTLYECPPELASDVAWNGIVLTGGGALLANMDKLIEGETGMPTRVAGNPLQSAATGTGKIAEQLHLFRRTKEPYVNERTIFGS